MYLSVLTTLAFAFATPITAAPASHCMETNLLGSLSPVQHALSANDPVKPLDDSSLPYNFTLLDFESNTLLGTPGRIGYPGYNLKTNLPRALTFFLQGYTLMTNDTYDKKTYAIGINPQYEPSWTLTIIPLDDAKGYVPVQMATYNEGKGSLLLNVTNAVANTNGTLTVIGETVVLHPNRTNVGGTDFVAFGIRQNFGC